MHHIFWYIVLLGYISVNIYLFVRGRQALPKNSIVYTLYTGIFLFVFASVISGVFFNDNLPVKLGNNLKVFAVYWIVFSFIFLLAALLADFLRLWNYSSRIFPAWVTKNYKNIKLFYFSSVLLFVLIISVIGYKKFSDPQIVELNLNTVKNNPEIENLSILAVSDIHVGNIIGRKRLAGWVKMINDQDPDLILLAGDIFDRSFNFSESPVIEQEFRKLKSRYGVYGVLGNHDYYAGVNKSINSIQHSGIILLRDTAVTIDSLFTIIGRDDQSNRRRKTIESLLTGLDTSLVVILLDHQPNLNESVKNKIDLQISGHLHNGQIFPYNLFLSLYWELVYGYRKVENTNFYVSSGLGLSYLPMRIGTQSEIVRIQFKQNADSVPAIIY